MASSGESSSYLSPESYLAQIGGGPTSAQREVWAVAHRLYLILTTYHSAAAETRLSVFRTFVRLCLRYHGLLLDGPVVAAVAAGGQSASALVACPVCRQRAATSTAAPSTNTACQCCWFHPDKQGRAVLTLLRELARHSAEYYALARFYGKGLDTGKLGELFLLLEGSDM